MVVLKIYLRNLVLFFISCHVSIFAQNIIEPENCILNTLGKASHTTGVDTSTIRFNCIKVFLKSAELKAIQINQNLLTQVTLQWFPRLQTIGPPYYLNESVRINVKNNSNQRLIYIVVGITNRETMKTEVYKLYVESAIEPFSVGYFTGSVITDTKVSTMDEFIEKYSWGIASVYGINK